ncbi:MAG: hypothetical protein QME42_05800 [bacterium]|nr:hypothetical protein [bacterium]
MKKKMIFLLLGLFLIIHEAKAELPDKTTLPVNVPDSLIAGEEKYTLPIMERLITKNLGPDVEEKIQADFNRSAFLTKCELAVMIVRLLDKEQEAEQYRLDALSLADEKDKQVSRQSGYIETCLKYGYLKGCLVDGDVPVEFKETGTALTRQTFSPDTEITKEQLLVVLIELLNNLYPEALGEKSIIVPLEGMRTVSEFVERLTPLKEFWSRDDQGKFIPGILAEAKALNTKLTQIEDVSLTGRYPGFVITAKKYLLEEDPTNNKKANSFLTDTYSLTVIVDGAFLPETKCRRDWAGYIFGKCFVGDYIPTERVVEVKQARLVDVHNKTTQIPAYGVFVDNWDIEGVIDVWTPEDIKERVIPIRTNTGQIIKLPVLTNSYIYTPVLGPFNIKRDLGTIYAPANEIYEDDRDRANVRGYKRVFFKPFNESKEQEICLCGKDGYSPVKILREGTKAIGKEKGYKKSISEKRKLFYGTETSLRSDYKRIDYFEMDIEKDADIHWGLYHGERVEVESTIFTYKSGKEFFEQKAEGGKLLTIEEMNKFYQHTPIRAYFIPHRPTNSQQPYKDYAGFVEIGFAPVFTTWYGLIRDKYPLAVKCWFDLKGKVEEMDVKFSADKFKIDTDDYLYDADGMGQDVSPVVFMPPGYRRFVCPAVNNEEKLKILQFDEPDYQRLLEQNLYIQLDPKGRVIFIESDILEEQ